MSLFLIEFFIGLGAGSTFTSCNAPPLDSRVRHGNDGKERERGRPDPGRVYRSRFFASLRMTGSWNRRELRSCFSLFRISLGVPALGRWPL